MRLKISLTFAGLQLGMGIIAALVLGLPELLMGTNMPIYFLVIIGGLLISLFTGLIVYTSLVYSGKAFLKSVKHKS